MELLKGQFLFARVVVTLIRVMVRAKARARARVRVRVRVLIRKGSCYSQGHIPSYPKSVIRNP